MSKSLGNFFTVRDLLDQGVPGEVIRFVMLSTHYRKPMDWTRRKALDAKIALGKMAGALGRFGQERLNDLVVGAPFEQVVDALGNDLNTHLAMAELRKLERAKAKDILDDQKWLNDLFASQLLLGFDLKEHPQALLRAKSFDGVLSIVQNIDDPLLAPFAAKLNELRAAAVISKDFSNVDALKMALKDAGVDVRISKDGVKLKQMENFDPSKLEALK